MPIIVFMHGKMDSVTKQNQFTSFEFIGFSTGIHILFKGQTFIGYHFMFVEQKDEGHSVIF